MKYPKELQSAILNNKGLAFYFSNKLSQVNIPGINFNKNINVKTITVFLLVFVLYCCIFFTIMPSNKTFVNLQAYIFYIFLSISFISFGIFLLSNVCKKLWREIFTNNTVDLLKSYKLDKEDYLQISKYVSTEDLVSIITSQDELNKIYQKQNVFIEDIEKVLNKKVFITYAEKKIQHKLQKYQDI